MMSVEKIREVLSQTNLYENEIQAITSCILGLTSIGSTLQTRVESNDSATFRNRVLSQQVDELMVAAFAGKIAAKLAATAAGSRAAARANVMTTLASLT